VDELIRLAKQKKSRSKAGLFRIAGHTAELKQPDYCGGVGNGRWIHADSDSMQVAAIHSLDVPFALTNFPVPMDESWRKFCCRLNSRVRAERGKVLQSLPLRARSARGRPVEARQTSRAIH